MKKIITILTIALTLIAFSCKKTETGPTGPQGVQGNANVQTTTQIIHAGDWDVIIPNYQYAKTINISTITQSIVDKGTVEIFQSSDGQSWGSLSSGLSYSYSLGKVIFVDNLNNTSPSMDYYYKIVVIAGQ